MKVPKILHYYEIGNGPLVVLLHGYMASGQYWNKVADELARNHRVIALDLLGFGQSPKPARSRYDYDAQIGSIERTLEHIGITEPFTLIGHSMGSLVSLRYANQYPDKVQKLMLTNMPIFLNPVEAKRVIMNTNIMYKIGLRPGLHHLVWPIFRASVLLKLLPEKAGEDARSRRSYLFQSTSFSRLRSLKNVIFAAKIETDLATLRMSTILLSGLQDRAGYIKDLASVETIGKHVTAIRAIGGHHLPLTQPKLIGQLVNGR